MRRRILPRLQRQSAAVAGGAVCAYHSVWARSHRSFIVARRLLMTRQAIHTSDAPPAIGTYSQAVRVGDAIYLSGQIGLQPATMTLAEGVDAQVHQVLRNLRAVAAAAGATLDDAVKMTVFLTDMGHFARVNEAMAQYFAQPYPARAAVAVAALPRGALVEIDAILVVGESRT